MSSNVSTQCFNSTKNIHYMIFFVLFLQNIKMLKFFKKIFSYIIYTMCIRIYANEGSLEAPRSVRHINLFKKKCNYLAMLIIIQM